jgi:hydroxyacylglutathione hydrolase
MFPRERPPTGTNRALRIERIWVGNPGRNFSYLVACEATGNALVVDPFDAGLCLAAAERQGWRITHVVNTHEHSDHIGGNAGLVAATGAQVLAHAAAVARIGHVDRTLGEGDRVSVGTSVDLEVLATPGHTMAHICLRAEEDVFSGDTLFNGGVGNCRKGGDAGVLYDTIVRVFGALPDSVRLRPGHEYLRRNLSFAVDREPGNARVQRMLERIENIEGARAPTLTMGDERQINVFLRAAAAEAAAGTTPAHGSAPATAKEVFLALRELRDRW